MILTLLLSLQQSADDLYKKCDSEIPWIADGTVLLDAEQLGRRPKNYRVDRAALLARAKERAAESKRLILWYCPRTSGGHMNRAQVLDQYMRVAVFTDPAVVAIVRERFVPLRMCLDPEIARTLAIRRFEFIEPGFLILSAEGRILHRIDRIRTFNAEWVRAILVEALQKHDPTGAPKDSDESPEGRALSLRRAGRSAEASRVEGAIVQRALALLDLDKIEEARSVLEKADSPESLYHLAYLDSLSARDPAPRWRALVEKHPESRWAWRAASNLSFGADTLSDGPMAHRFEDFALRRIEGMPTTTRLPAPDADAAARRALRFLVTAQAENGSWNDSRYVYCPDPEILPNVLMAVTALAALALAEWRDLDPKGIDPALARADAFVRDDRTLHRGKNEECYAEAYRLLYFAHRKDAKAMNASVERLAAIQDAGGHWAHEYPNPFATAAVVHSLTLAKRAGADVPDKVFRLAGEGLARDRSANGLRWAYARGPASSERNSMARAAMGELAFHEVGKTGLESVGAAVDSYWKHLDRLETVRTADFHADEELGGFFFFHGVFHACEAALALPEEKRREHLRRFREQMLAIPEIDGSYVDSHELGKGYGTAMALLVLRRAR